MKKTMKDVIKLVAKEYVKQYQMEEDVYNALKPFNIYVTYEGKLSDAYLEHILNDISDDLSSALCDFASNGSVELKSNRCSEWETVTDIDRIIDIYMEDYE